MALVNVVNMVVLDNPTNFSNPFQFEITFECLQELEDDLEWKVLYVGSAQDASRDQVLDEILVGPVPVGVNKFVLQADAPDPSKLLEGDLLGVTVVLVTCSYKEREFVRVGYYVNNEYHDPNAPPPVAMIPPPSSGENNDDDAPPPQPLPPSLPKPIPIEHIQRQILADKPRVTKFPISWGEDPTPQTAPQPEEESMNDNSNTGSHPFASSNGMVDMPEESNASFSGQGGVQSMRE